MAADPRVNYPIQIPRVPMYRGDGPARNKVTIKLEDADGDPVDLTIYGPTWKAMATGSGKTITLDVDTSTLASGVVELRVKTADSPDLASVMNYDVQASGGSLGIITPFAGTFDTTGEVTKP